MHQVTLWSHQKEAVARAINDVCFGYFFDPGTGKTLASITTLRHIFARHNRLLKTLIFAPPIVLENWRREWLMYSKISRSNIHVLYGSGKKRLQLFKEVAALPCIVITNYESLYMTDLFNEFMAWQPEVLIFDESHKLKEITAKRTKLAIKISDISGFRYLLTGTPILNDPLDIFPQFRCLDGGRTFGKNYYEFRSHYFYDKNAGMPKQKYFPDWRPRVDRFSELNQKISRLSMTVKKKDCLTLPPLIRQEVLIELNGEQKRLYTEMEKQFITTMNDGTCSAMLAITKGLRLQQIASGFIPVKVEKDDGTTEGKVIPIEDDPRSQALLELLEQITPNSKVLVWAVFKENYRMIADVCEKLKVPYVRVTGEETAKQKQSAVDTLNTDESIRVLIGHPGAGGIGINLVAASYMIFFSRGFSLEYDIQAESRNYRGGSERHATINRIDIIAKGTIDEKVTKALAAKQTISDKLLFQAVNELTEERETA